MNLAEAWTALVTGEKVRADDMQEGSYLTYEFSGLRINFANGSSSGYRTKQSDETATWEIVKPVEGWACFAEPKPEPVKEGWADYG